MYIQTYMLPSGVPSEGCTGASVAFATGEGNWVAVRHYDLLEVFGTFMLCEFHKLKKIVLNRKKHKFLYFFSQFSVLSLYIKPFSIARFD